MNKCGIVHALIIFVKNNSVMCHLHIFAPLLSAAPEMGICLNTGTAGNFTLPGTFKARMSEPTGSPVNFIIFSEEVMDTISGINSSTALTNLAQLGVEFNPSPRLGGGGGLRINLSTLQSAFNINSTEAISLLTTVANAFKGLADNFLAQASNPRTSITAELLANSVLSEAQSTGDLSSLLAIESMTGVPNLQQDIFAMNEFNLVAGLLGPKSKV
jgi:hypothetical protein